MKAKLLCFFTVLLIVFTTAAFAKEKYGDKGWLNNEKTHPQVTIYLLEKTPATGPGPWVPVTDGANGKLEYNLWGAKFKFDFTGKGLTPSMKYTLIYYPDPWPGTGLICLGSDTASLKGRVDIDGKVDVGNLPKSLDANAVSYTPGGLTGAKIWLVPSLDVYCGDPVAPTPVPGYMLGWNPSKILFESAAITYFKTPLTP